MTIFHPLSLKLLEFNSQILLLYLSGCSHRMRFFFLMKCGINVVISKRVSFDHRVFIMQCQIYKEKQGTGLKKKTHSLPIYIER